MWCVTHGHVVEAALGYFLAPIGLVLAGVVMFHEQLRRAQVVALVLCGVAVVVLAVGYGSPPYFALLIAVSWTTYGVFKKREALPPLEGLAAETIVLAPVAVVLLLVMQVARQRRASKGRRTLQLTLVPLTGVATTVPLLLFAYAARRVRLAMLGWTAVLGADDQPGARRRGLRRVHARVPHRRLRARVDRARAHHRRRRPRVADEPATVPPVETEPVPLEG